MERCAVEHLNFTR